MKRQSGQILVLALITVALVLVNTLVIVSGSQLFSQNAHYNLQATQALNLAEAGVDKAITALNATGGSYSGELETSFGAGSFSVNVSTVNANTKVIESTGYIPNAISPKAKRVIKITASKGIGASFNYGIQVGDGGLEMEETSRVNGSVYSNGSIVMDNNARITGDAYVAAGTAGTSDQEADCVSPNCADFIFGTSVGGNNRIDTAQSFQPSASGNINKVALKLKKIGSPADIAVRIVKDDDGEPDKNEILASGTLSGSLVTTQYSFVEVAFSTTPNLDEGETYWITLDAAQNSSNYWSFSADTVQGYTFGGALWSPDSQAGNPSWTPVPYDFGFKTYMGGVVNSITGGSGVIIGGNAYANTLRNLSVTGGAYYQAMENVTAGSYNPGSPDPAPKSMPVSDGNISFWKNLAEGEGVYTGDITTCVGTIGPGKYVGSVSLPLGCAVTVTDPVWITGDVTLGNGASLRLNPSYGSSSGVFITDGRVILVHNNNISGSGESGSFLLVISGYDSTINGVTAIDISNGGITGAFLAPKGLALVRNTNRLNEMTAWKVHLNNGVIIDYDSGLSSAFFSSGPSGAYSLVKGTYQIK